MKFNWFQTQNSNAWDAHVRKQKLRKLRNGLIVLSYIAGGVFIFMYETGRFDVVGSINKIGRQTAQTVSTDTASLSGPNSLPEVGKNSGDVVSKNQNVAPAMPIIHPDELIFKNEPLNESKGNCSTPFNMPSKKTGSNLQAGQVSLLLDLDFADRLRNRYASCVADHLEQPYATVAMAISAIFAYRQDDLSSFNFLGEKVWAGKKFNDAGEYFLEFSLIYNPVDIDNEYFDKFQGQRIPLEEQYWRAYVEYFFRDVNPKLVRELMNRWGYEYTEPEQALN